MHFNIILSYIILLIITFSCAYFFSLVLWSVMLYAFLILLSLMMLNLFSLCQRVAWISGWQLYMCRSGRLPTIWQGTLEKPGNIKGILSFVMLCWAICESLKITFRVRQFLFQLRSTTHVNTFQVVRSGEGRRPRQVVKVLNSEGKVIAYAKPWYPMVRTSSRILYC